MPCTKPRINCRATGKQRDSLRRSAIVSQLPELGIGVIQIASVVEIAGAIAAEVVALRGHRAVKVSSREAVRKQCCSGESRSCCCGCRLRRVLRLRLPQLRTAAGLTRKGWQPPYGARKAVLYVLLQQTRHYSFGVFRLLPDLFNRASGRESIHPAFGQCGITGPTRKPRTLSWRSISRT